MYTALLQGSLRLSKFGEWWHEGTPFANQRLATLFHHSIIWEPERQLFVIRLGKQQAIFDVEDTAFFVVQLNTEVLPWTIELNDGRILSLNPRSLQIGDEGQFYCLVPKERAAEPNRPPSTESEVIHVRARFMRSPHQLLLEHAVDEHSLMISGMLVSPFLSQAQK